MNKKWWFMKYLLLSVWCFLVVSIVAHPLYASQHVEISQLIDSKSHNPYYSVTLDFGGVDDYDAHFIIGQKYAEALLNNFRSQGGFEITASAFLRTNLDALNRSGLRFKDMMGQVSEFMNRTGVEGDVYYLAGAEIEGMNSVFNSDRNGYSASDRLWWLIFNENQLTLRELYLLNMMTSGLVGPGPKAGPASCRTMLESFRAVYTVKNRHGKKDKVCEGYLGCLLSAAASGENDKMLSGVDTGNPSVPNL